MAVSFKLRGPDKVLANLNKEVKGIKGRSLKGLVKASFIVRRSMDKNVPKIPVDFGNLRSSWFTVGSDGQVKEGKNIEFKEDVTGQMARDHRSSMEKYSSLITGPIPAIMMGFTANYALWVHENIGAEFQRPGAGAKFFEVSLDRNEKEMLEVIRKEAQIK